MGLVIQTPPQSLERDRIEHQLDKLLGSGVLHGSDTLCRLLRFLVNRSLDQPEMPVKEYEIATSLLGRSEDFDPRVDPVVRVQVGRLRSKLVEYYATEGSQDSLHIDIPKGSYTPLFAERGVPLETAERLGTTTPAAVGAASRAKPRRSIRVLQIALLLICGAALQWSVARLRSTTAAAQPQDALRSFWQPFLQTEDPALVVFSNAPFVGRPEIGLRYYEPGKDSPSAVLDHYTGVGEVFAVHTMDEIFHQFNSRYILKRGQLLNWDDAKDRPVIFIGSTSENLRLREVPWAHKFVFETRPNGARRELYIRNLTPVSGEPQTFGPVDSQNLVEDYAIVSLFPGPDSVHSMLLLAGITTLGTQAAVEFVCNSVQLARLRETLPGHQFVPFSAVLSVQLKGGVPVSSRVIATAPLRHR